MSFVPESSLRVLEPEVTIAGSMGRMVITILGMVADMELKFIKDRQRAGIYAAKAEGIYRGVRRPSMTPKFADRSLLVQQRPPLPVI